MYKYNVNVVRVVDGDTVDVDIDLGFGVWLHKERVRLMGIDTPESRTRDLEEKFYGLEAKKFLNTLLLECPVTLVSHEKGKFGRILGELFIYGNTDKSVNQMMVDNFHAVPYNGGNKVLTEQQHLENREHLEVSAGIKF